MTLAELVSTYGYAAVLAGTLLEGESILLLAGFAAHRGHLSLEVVLFVAFVGGTLGDQIFFWIGRRWGPLILERWPGVRARAGTVARLLDRWDAALVFSIRFLYGLRIAGPVAMGALGFSRRRFAIFNALGAAVWSVLIGGAGYAIGHSLEAWLGDLERYEGRIFWGAVIAIGVGFAGQHLVQAIRKRARKTADLPSRP